MKKWEVLELNVTKKEKKKSASWAVSYTHLDVYKRQVYAMIGSSVALSISDIPFAGPTAAVVVGMVDGEYILNPTLEQMEASRLNLTVAGTKDAVMMVEAGAKELSEDEMLEAILFAHEEIKRICAFISDIQAEIGEEKQVIAPEEHDEDFDAKVTEAVKERVEWSLSLIHI